MKCIVTDYVHPNLDWEARQYKEAGIDFKAFQMRMASPTELLLEIADADVLVVDSAEITADVIAGLSRCQLIIRHGDGYNNLDLQAATAHGIACANKPGIWSREVAEQALMLASALALQLPRQRSVAAAPKTGTGGGWHLERAMPQRRLGALTVGVVGFGKIGRIAARLFGGVFGSVLVNDPYVAANDIAAQGFEVATLDEVLGRADVITLHVPATSETTDLINEHRIASMKTGAMLVNTARGGIVNTSAVLAALESGQLGGVALDTTNPEPLPADHPLQAHPAAIITPHMAFYSEESVWTMRRSIVADVIAASEGRLPESVVNPEVLESPGLRAR